MSGSNSPIERINVLGVGVSAINVALAVAEVKRWIKEGRREYVCVTGMHGVVESLHAEPLRVIHNHAGLVTPDGMPMVWLLWYHGHKNADRVRGADFMAAILEYGATQGWRHYFYGTKPETLAQLEARLKTRIPDLKIAGSLSPPFRELTPEEDEAIVAEINGSGADIVWVGTGQPKQEIWIDDKARRAGHADGAGFEGGGGDGGAALQFRALF